MGRLTRVAVVPIALGVFLGPVPAAEPERDDLLAAWEAIQREDPATLVFEEIEPRSYRFETERFPYDGELRVLNLSIDERPYIGDENMTMGVVEVELVDAGDDFLVKHGHSYGLWQQINVLYYDSAQEQWISSREWQARMSEEYSGWLSPVHSLSNLLWLLVPLLLVVFIGFAVWRANRQMKSAMAAQDRALADQKRAIELTERALEVSEDSNRILRDILGEVRQRGPSSRA